VKYRREIPKIHARGGLTNAESTLRVFFYAGARGAAEPAADPLRAHRARGALHGLAHWGARRRRVERSSARRVDASALPGCR